MTEAEQTANERLANALDESSMRAAMSELAGAGIRPRAWALHAVSMQVAPSAVDRAVDEILEPAGLAEPVGDPAALI